MFTAHFSLRLSEEMVVHRLSLLGRTWIFVWLIAMVPLISHAQTFTTLAVFSGSNGGGPNGPLLQAADGNFYGTTLAGGAFRNGTVFKMTPSGALTVLHSFSDSEGSTPEAPLIQASDGNFYGTTYTGGAVDFCQLNFIGCGTVFEITPTGAETVLYSFMTNPSNPSTGLVQGTDGNFYGTTEGGTIFRLTPGGAYTALEPVPGPLNGVINTASKLIEATDGNFYGATSFGVFKLTSSGVSTMLATFPSNSGTASALVQGTDGNFYGTTNSGGVNRAGSVFSVSPAGALTILYSFTAAGGTPSSALIQGTDGAFYGTTSGISASPGVLYRITPAGVISILHTFNAGDNANGLVQGTDGNLYGTTRTGGGQLAGSVFVLTLGGSSIVPPAISAGGVTPIFSTSNTIQPGEWVSIFGTNLASGPASWTGNFPMSLGGTSVTIDGKAAYLSYVSPSQINLQAPDDTAAGSVSVVVQTANGSATTSVTLGQIAPSLFLLDGKHLTGIILRSDGSGAYGGGTYDIIGPSGTSLGYPTVAAKAGDSLVLFGTGFGPTNPSVAAGQAFSEAAATTNPVQVLINGVNVNPAFAGLSGAGLDQVNLTLPAGLGTGDVPIVASMGGLATQTGVVISLQ